MKAKILVYALLALILATIHLAEAQRPGKVYRVGFLDFRSRSTTTDARFVALRQGLRELGYVEGQNLVIEYRSAKGKGELLPEVTEELVKLRVDVIVAAGSPLVWNAAKKATSKSLSSWRAALKILLKLELSRAWQSPVATLQD